LCRVPTFLGWRPRPRLWPALQDRSPHTGSGRTLAALNSARRSRRAGPRRTAVLVPRRSPPPAPAVAASPPHACILFAHPFVTHRPLCFDAFALSLAPSTATRPTRAPRPVHAPSFRPARTSLAMPCRCVLSENAIVRKSGACPRPHPMVCLRASGAGSGSDDKRLTQ